MDDGKAGPRWSELLNICEIVTDNSDQFTNTEVEFCNRLMPKFQSYKEDTYVTVAQINWLRSLEARAEELRLV